MFENCFLADGGNELSNTMEEGFAKKDDRLVGDALKHLISWETESYRKNPEPFEEEKKKRAEWKEGVDNTKVENAYRNTDKTDIRSFTDSILGQSRFWDRDFLRQNLQEFADILAGGDDFPLEMAVRFLALRRRTGKHLAPNVFGSYGLRKRKRFGKAWRLF